jgi:N utilization substance protein A
VSFRLSISLRRLLENEVPEIYHGMVEIRSIAREPGHRSKVAVSALQAGVDPVGACVGIRGVRIQAIVRELNDEKIDVIEWNSDHGIYIAKALSPARVTGVFLNEYTKGTKTATVVVPEDQLSLAIGRDGQNARLAAKLTSWRIDIKSLPESATDALHRLQSEPGLAQIKDDQEEILPQVEIILAKKAEGRPVTPEEYQVLTQFVDRVERGAMRIQEDARKAEEEREQVARAGIPDSVFEMPMADFDVSDRLYAIISEIGFDTVGDLMLRHSMDPDSLYKLHGMGPKSWAVFETALDKVKQEAQAQELARQEAEAQELARQEAEKELALKTEAEEEVTTAEPAEVAEEPVEEPVAEADAEAQVEAADVTETTEVSEEGEAESLEDVFAVDLAEFDIDATDEELEEDEKKKKKEKRKKFIEIEYDPDQDVTLVKKKRKRGEEKDWETEW